MTEKSTQRFFNLWEKETALSICTIREVVCSPGLFLSVRLVYQTKDDNKIILHSIPFFAGAVHKAERFAKAMKRGIIIIGRNIVKLVMLSSWYFCLAQKIRLSRKALKSFCLAYLTTSVK